MRVAIAVFLTVLTCSSPTHSTAQEIDHVVLISVDGLRPEFYLDDSWPAPVMQELAAEGSAARRVETVFPSVTYPSHTTMVTGALPARHGILYNSPFTQGESIGEWYWWYDSVRVDNLWEALNRSGSTTAAVNWPVSAGAPITYNIPEIWPLDWSVSRREFLAEHVNPPGLLRELEREATGRLVDFDSDGPTEFWRFSVVDGEAGQIAAYLFARYRPSLLAVHFIHADEAQHNHGRDHPEVRKAVSAIDSEIGRIVSMVNAVGAADRTAILVVGDHGFIDYEVRLTPNVWLVNAGLRPVRRERDNWRATFHGAGGGAVFLKLHPEADDSTLREVRAAIADLPDSVRSRFEVVDQHVLRELGADPTAVMALSARNGTTFSTRAEPYETAAITGGTHGYRPDFSTDIYTGLIAYGPPFGAGLRVEEIHLAGVAPLIAHLLGVEVRSRDGSLPEGLLAQD